MKFLKQIFFSFRSWISHMSSVITDDELPDNVTSAESFLTRHQEHKAEIDTRQRSVNEFYEAADKLIADGHSASADVKEKKQRLAKAWQALQNTWSAKGVDLEHSKEVQMFKRDADQLEAWLNARELDQESSDVGDSLDAVEELLKKHDEFEKMLLAQEMKLLGITKLTRQEEGFNRLKEEEDEMKQEEGRKRKEDEREIEMKRKMQEEEEQAKTEQEYRDRKRLEQIRIKEESEKKEKDRKQQEEIERQRVLEEKKRAEERAKQEEQKKRQEAEKRLRLDEQRRRDEQNNNSGKSVSSPQGQRKVSDPSTVEGILQRKQELESGGRKAHARVWKTLYTVLRGRQLFFYREKKDSQSINYAAPPLDLTDGFCEEASDAARRKNAFRLLCDDDSEFFFVAKDPQDLSRWMEKISTAAGQIDLPSPPPPPQATRLQSPTTSPRIERLDGSESPEVTKPYGRTPKPLITVTSFDDDENVLIDPPPPPPVSVPPPAVSPEFSNGSALMGTESGDENDILADIGSLPPEPNSLPPAFPPPDFADFADSSDGDDIPILPASPPPEFLSDDEHGLDSSIEDSPLAHIISELQQPVPPPRSKTKPARPPVTPKPEGRLRSDSRDSSDSGGKGPKPPVKPKPANLSFQRPTNNRQARGAPGSLRSAVDNAESAHDDKRHDKKKGVLGNIFKKKR